MKKTVIKLLTFMVILILVACSGKSSENNLNSDTSDLETVDYEMPDEMKLMLGTVRLDETEYAIDAEQAADLLPLWKTLRSLASSETAAQAEVDAVITAIQEAMTADQIGTIESMGLTMQDFAGVAEILGIETGFGSRFGEISPEMQATIEAAREDGEWPPEGFEGGFGPGGGPEGGLGLGGGRGPGGGIGPGGGFGSDTGITPEMRETAMAERGGGVGRGFGINTVLLDAIINFLEVK
jgi:hypothetical protein